jgi:chemotaxis protein histidine kinase CheA
MGAEESAGTARLMTFRVGRGRFAVHLDGVLGVQEQAAVAAGAAPTVTFLGRPVPVVDARALGWGGAAPPAARGPAIVVGRGDGAATALLVERVEGIVAGLVVRPLPALVAPFVRGVFCGVALDAEGERLVVDPAALAAMAVETAAGGGRGGPRGA